MTRSLTARRFAPSRSLLRPAAGLLGLSLVLGVPAGCASLDQQAFESTHASPKSVAILDARTNESLWSYDVPIGYVLELDGQHADGDNWFQGATGPAETIDWEVVQIVTGDTLVLGDRAQEGTIDLPDGCVPRIEVTMRPIGSDPQTDVGLTAPPAGPSDDDFRLPGTTPATEPADG